LVWPRKNSNTILFEFENDKDIFHLMCIKDFVDENWPAVPCHLIMPYIPYSRMDRAEEQRLFTLKSFTKIINSLNFATVTVWEPHSDVSPALINRVRIINKSSYLATLVLRKEIEGITFPNRCSVLSSLSNVLSTSLYISESEKEKGKEKGIYFVFPDAGAEKRYSKQIKYPNVLTCSKTRDFETGEIKKLEVNGYERAQDCRVAIIVDDLASKGGTFVFTASQLREYLPHLEKIILCVTHCENTIYEGSVLSGNEIDEVYTTDSIVKEREGEKKLIVIKG
jgi:ribose-phosphate pyrophosphokinase